jgi:hypothetical protein
MRNLIPAGVRAVVVPTLACSLVCGGAVAALGILGVRAGAGATAGPVAGPAAPALRPPATVVVRTPPPPPVTVAPTGKVWVVTYRR